MKDVIKYIFLFVLVLFSFYYTDKISMILIDNSSLMKKIKEEKDKFEVSSIDAIIDAEFIVPGKNGLKVNLLESYHQMKKDNRFDKDKLVFDEVIPEQSINYNKDMIINKGRYDKKGISLVFKDNQNIIKYLNNNNIKMTRLVNKETFKSDAQYEQIAIDKDVDSLLNKYKLNKMICFDNYIDREKCYKDSKYLSTYTYYIENVLSIDNKLISGNILYLDDYLNEQDFKLILNKIYHSGLSLYYLSEIISEKASY